MFSQAGHHAEGDCLTYVHLRPIDQQETAYLRWDYLQCIVSQNYLFAPHFHKNLSTQILSHVAPTKKRTLKVVSSEN
jgi:hypothetical protein